MLTLEILKKYGIRPIADSYTFFGGDGIYGEAQPYADNKNEYWRIILWNNPKPPGETINCCYCFNENDIINALNEHLTYYKDRVKLEYKQETV